MFTLIIGVYFCVPLFVLAVFWHSLQHVRAIKLATINFFVGYIFLLFGIYLYEIYLEYRLLSFDSNQDGIFSDEESTLEQGRYMSLLINDTARRFAPIVGVIFSLIQSILFYLALFIYNIYRQR